MSFDNYGDQSQQDQGGQRQQGNSWNNNQRSQGGGNGGNGYTQNNYRSNNGGQGSYGGGNNGYNKGGGGGNWKGGGGGFQRKEPEGPAELYLPYVATGNQDAPPHILDKFTAIVKELEQRGYTMRNGGMKGPEDVCERNTVRQEIHLPWKGFDEKDSKFTFTTNHAKELAGKFQPGYDGLKPVIQTFLAKNVRMIMGKDLKSPALFMIIWSEDGADSLETKTARTGNVGHPIAIADALKIPVFNLGNPQSEQRLKSYLNFTNNHVQEQKPQPVQQQQSQPPVLSDSTYF